MCRIIKNLALNVLAANFLLVQLDANFMLAPTNGGSKIVCFDAQNTT